ncbi:hsdFM [Symbiodinium sp. CCMP2592]|nr:hsdFM [Symbiodinium sp. CCMP2592]
MGSSKPAPRAAKVKKTAAGADAAAASLAAVAVGASAHLQATPQAVTQNSTVLTKHKENVTLVHSDFGPDFEMQDPPHKSWLRAFDESAAVSDLKRYGKHTCLVNAAWLDHDYSPCPSIPLVWKTVENMIEHYFAQPNNLSDQKIEVVVLSSDLAHNKFPTKGSWKFASAEEPVMAMYAAIASTIQARRDGEGVKTNEELQKMDDQLCIWKEKLLETQVDIKVMDNEIQLQWAAQQYRENINQRTYLTRTSVQRIFDLQAKSTLLGPHASNEDLARLYNENLKLSSKSEPISDNFVDQGLLVYKKALVFPEILQVILKEEEYHTSSLFDGVSKLWAICNKTSTREEAFWVFSFIHHCRCNGDMPDKSCTSFRILAGTAKDHHQGLVDVILYQHRIKSYLLSEFLPVVCKHLPDEVRAKIRSACADCQAYREHVGVGQESVDLGWKSGWSGAADSVLLFLGEAIFSAKYHDSMRTSMRQAKSVEDCLESDSKLGEAVKEVKEQLQNERLASAETAPSAGDPTSAVATDVPMQETLEMQSPALQEFVKSRGMQNVDVDKLKKLQMFEKKARMLVQSNVALHVFVEKEKDLMAAIHASPAGQVRGKDHSWVGIFVDPVHIGEPATAPHIRVAPCNQKYLKNLISSIVKTRDPMQTCLHPRDMFLLFDSGVHTQQSKMLACILNNEGNQMPMHQMKVYVTYDENALRERRKSQRTSLDQTEQLTLVTSEEFGQCMLQRPRKAFPGSNFGNVVGPVRPDAPGELWQLSVEEKLAIYGKYRMAVGGRTPGEDPDQSAGRGCGKPRTTVEPVFWHGRPEIMYQEMVSSYGFTALIDCQAADGVLASLAATERLPYIGFCLTETHLKKLQEVVVFRVLKEMARPNSKVHESKLVETLGAASSSATPTPATVPQGGGNSGGGSTSTAQSVLSQFQVPLHYGPARPTGENTQNKTKKKPAAAKPASSSSKDPGTATKTIKHMKKPAAAKAKGKPAKASAKAGAKKGGKTVLARREPVESSLHGAQHFYNFPADVSLCSDCSGMGTEFMAAKLAFPNANVKHNYASDSDPVCRSFLKHYVNPKVVADNIENDIPADWALCSDFYICGYPCQPFSQAGKQEGVADAKGRGSVIVKVPFQIARLKPKAFVLENVLGMVQRFPRTFNLLIDTLRCLELEPGSGPSYNVYWNELSADKRGGTPQHRERLFVVGIKASSQVHHFEWPKPLPGSLTLSECMGVGTNPPLPPTDKLSKTVRKSMSCLEALRTEHGPQDIICDVGSSNSTYFIGKSPCLTAFSCSSFRYYSTARGRWLNCNDFLALQGMSPSAFPDWQKIVDPKPFGRMLGNAIHAQILKRILVQIARAQGWRCHGGM